MRGPIDLNVINDQMIGIQALVLGVALGILQQMEKKFSGLLRPSTLSSAMNFGLGMTTDASHEPAEWDDFLLVDDVLEVGYGTM